MRKFYDKLYNIDYNRISVLGLKTKISCLLYFSLTVFSVANATPMLFNDLTLAKPIASETIVQELISGTLTDAEGVPIPGVLIQVQGTTSGTQSDADGKYSLEVKTGDVLVFSFWGMKTVTLTVGNESIIDLTMEQDSKNLDEVVVVGYGIQNKATLTGAVTNIKTEEISEISASNLTSLLAGRLSGVSISSSTGTPGVPSNLTIRTRGTWNSDSPIYVIDGIVKDKADFDALDVNEVAEISVLKDAASAAIYGSRASNGVVLVRTKTGKSGKPTITYTNSYNFEKPTQLPKMMSGVDIAHMANSVSDSEWFSWSPEDISWLETVNNGYGYDYLGEVYRDPASNRHAISISGGNENVKYYLGGSVFKQTGFLDPLKFDKQNLRANVEVKLSENLTANVNLALVNSKREKFRWEYDYGNDALPDLWKKLQTWQFYEPSSVEGNAPNLGWLGNVGELINNSGYWRNRTQSQSAILSLKYKIQKVEGLSLKATYAFDNSIENLKIFDKKHTLYNMSGQTIHNYSQVKLDGTTSLSNGPSREGIYESASVDRSYQFNTQINYERTFGNHHVDALLVYEQSEGFNNNFSARRYDFPILIRDQWNQTSGLELLHLIGQ